MELVNTLVNTLCSAFNPRNEALEIGSLSGNRKVSITRLKNVMTRIGIGVLNRTSNYDESRNHPLGCAPR